jgi:7-cyano-7-deazaguanine synthase
MNILLFSGGMDSTTLLSFLLNQKQKTIPIFINYGQNHARQERKVVNNICKLYGLDYKEINLPNFLESGLTNNEVPFCHYEDDKMKQIIVPNRNMILISIAVSVAIQQDCKYVYIAPHKGDKKIFPDCRKEFIESINEVLKTSETGIQIKAPFLNYNKRMIAQIAHRINSPIELTWTCYVGDDSPCGKCGACVERKEALENL